MQKEVYFLVLFISSVHCRLWQRSDPMPPTTMATNASEAKPRISLLSSQPYTIYNGPVSPLSEQLVLDKLRLVEGWLPNYEIEFINIDDICDDALTVDRLMPYVMNTTGHWLPIILSVGCQSVGLKAMAEVGIHYNYISIGFLSASEITFNDRDRFSSYFILGEPQTTVIETGLALVAMFGWTNIAMLSERHTYYESVRFFVHQPHFKLKFRLNSLIECIEMRLQRRIFQ